MTGFSSVTEVVDAEIAGKTLYRTWRKTPSVVTVAGQSFDLSMSPGVPKPQYYASAPGEAAQMSRSLQGGIDHGATVSPETKYLRKITVLSTSAGAVPQRMILCDYLMYYPFIDMSDPIVPMVNDVSLPRYSDGEGVQILPVLVAPHSLVGDFINLSYTNSDGVAGRTLGGSGFVRMQAISAVNGSILCSGGSGGGGPFLPLQAGDSGVRSIESAGPFFGTDVGLYTLVLVKPLAEITLRGIDAPTEKDFLLDAGMKMPEIKDGAYLNFVTTVNGSLSAAPIHGDITFTWT